MSATNMKVRCALAFALAAACHHDKAAPPSSFGLYLLAMQWAPNACCAHPGKEAGAESCGALAGSYAATHVTLHGLWPSYTDDESRGRPRPWPQYCGALAHCEHDEDASCAPGVPVPPDLAARAPAYITDHGALATHEWSKHGSCTRLSPAAYFAAELAAIRSLPGDGTPDVLSAAAGKDVARADLSRAFGIPPEAVALGCDAHCELTQVGFCLGHDAADQPTTPIACPHNVLSSEYDNGCVTRGCERVVVQAAGECGR